MKEFSLPRIIIICLFIAAIIFSAVMVFHNVFSINSLLSGLKEIHNNPAFMELKEQIRISNLLPIIIFGFIIVFLFSGLFLYIYRHSVRMQSEYLLQNLSAQLLATYEGEKKLLSFDIHDDIAQELYTARLLCGKKNEAAERIESALRKLRDIAYQLQPPELELLGLAESVEDLCRNIHKPQNLSIKCSCSDIRTMDMDYSVKIHVYRIVQEALNNIIKHSGAENAEVKIFRKKTGIKVEIRDDGKGFVLNNVIQNPDHKQLGLHSMRERAGLIDGKISLTSYPGKGTRINFTIPHL